MNVALENHGDPNSLFYLAQLADDPWHTVGESLPHGGLVCEGLYGRDGAYLQLEVGSRVLRGYFYSRHDERRRKYGLMDAEFANTGRLDDDLIWSGFPLVYFPAWMVLRADFHLQPVAHKGGVGRHRSRVVLSAEDSRDIQEAAGKHLPQV